VQALERLSNSFKNWAQTEETKVSTGVPVNDSDVKVVIEQYEISTEEAQDALRRNNGDLKQTLIALSH
jgi:NACalpha-BTF3-like transcription factor